MASIHSRRSINRFASDSASDYNTCSVIENRMNIRTRAIGVLRLALALIPIGATLTLAVPAAVSPPRQPGPCDIYGAAGTPCVAAHSTTRALYASYQGALYQIKRHTDGKALDIGLEAGGYADAVAQDAFCAQATCILKLIYDQAG